SVWLTRAPNPVVGNSDPTAASGGQFQLARAKSAYFDAYAPLSPGRAHRWMRRIPLRGGAVRAGPTPLDAGVTLNGVFVNGRAWARSLAMRNASSSLPESETCFWR